MYHFSSYWDTWSRVLSQDHAGPGGRFVEVNLTPGGGLWTEKVAPVIVRVHWTSLDRGSRDQLVEELPVDVWDLMVGNIGADLATWLVEQNIYEAIDWDRYKIAAPTSSGGIEWSAICLT